MKGALAVLIAYLLGVVVAVLSLADHTEYHEEIIRHGCAEYDSGTGEFTWKGTP